MTKHSGCECTCASDNSNPPLPSQQLAQLGIILPPVSKPVAAYVPVKQTGKMVQTSGQLPMIAGKIVCTGKLGADVTIEEGKEAARLCAINALAALATVNDDLGIDAIKNITHVTVYVNSAPNFTDQALVANGASELLQEVFKHSGVHTRSAVGVVSLPLGASVEVEVRAHLKG